MNKNKIQIDGVWYVRENTIKIPDLKDMIKANCTKSESIFYENKDYSFKATRLKRSDIEYFPNINIEIIDKKPKGIYNWDSSERLINVYEGFGAGYNEAFRTMNDENLLIFGAFLSYLAEEGWFVN